MAEPVYQPAPRTTEPTTPPWPASQTISVILAPLLLLGQWATFLDAVTSLDSTTPQKGSAAQMFTFCVLLGASAVGLAFYGVRSRLRWTIALLLAATGLLLGLALAPGLAESFGGYATLGFVLLEVWAGGAVIVLWLVALLVGLVWRRPVAWSLAAGAFWAHAALYLVLALWALVNLDALAAEAARRNREASAWGALAVLASSLVAAALMRRRVA